MQGWRLLGDVPALKESASSCHEGIKLNNFQVTFTNKLLFQELIEELKPVMNPDPSYGGRTESNTKISIFKLRFGFANRSFFRLVCWLVGWLAGWSVGLSSKKNCCSNEMVDGAGCYVESIYCRTRLCRNF